MRLEVAKTEKMISLPTRSPPPGELAEPRPFGTSLRKAEVRVEGSFWLKLDPGGRAKRRYRGPEVSGAHSQMLVNRARAKATTGSRTCCIEEGGIDND